MKRTLSLLALLTLGAVTTPVLADPHKDESGHGHHGHGHKGGEYKEEYWDGDCQVKRKWDKHGEYKEERKCEGGRHYGSYPPPVRREPGIVVQPPAVVIQPPPIVIR